LQVAQNLVIGRAVRIRVCHGSNLPAFALIFRSHFGRLRRDIRLFWIPCHCSHRTTVLRVNSYRRCRRQGQVALEKARQTQPLFTLFFQGTGNRAVQRLEQIVTVQVKSCPKLLAVGQGALQCVLITHPGQRPAQCTQEKEVPAVGSKRQHGAPDQGEESGEQRHGEHKCQRGLTVFQQPSLLA